MIFGGLRIIADPTWPKVADGTYTARFPNHPLICGLDRKLPWLGIGQFTESTFKKFRDADPMIDQRGSIVYCSPAQYAEMARAMRREVPAGSALRPFTFNSPYI